VERAFRTLKTMLELRPLYDRLPDRIRSQVLLCWLALLLERLAERESGQGWARCRELLQEIHRVDLKGKDGSLQLTCTLAEEHRKLLKSLRINPPPRIQKAQPTLKSRRHYASGAVAVSGSSGYGYAIAFSTTVERRRCFWEQNRRRY
jgi:hypothetical protein